MLDANLLSKQLQDKATLSTSRRAFLAGSRLALGAAVGLALLGSAPAKAVPGDGNGNGIGGGGDNNPPGVPRLDGCGPSGGQPPKCCFLPGTKIATPNGAVEIEKLAIGDHVLTIKSGAKPVKWIGRQQFERAGDPGAAPVKISRFAIDGKAPTADLYVSPAHAIYIDDILIPAVNLVNGITVCANAKPEMETITYYHVEFDTHEVILAEGLAVESFLGGNRSAFENADEYVRLYGSLGEPMTPFAPIVAYCGGRQELASHIRSALARIYDFRKPIDKVRDRLANSAESSLAA
jgi:hypothetical protein